MKKKSNLDLPATKRDLQEAVSGLATKKELRKFVAKTEFRRAVSKLATKKELLREVGQLELKMERGFKEQDKKARQYRDEILTAVQRFAGDTQVLKEEMMVAAHRTENHEERITFLEQKFATPA